VVFPQGITRCFLLKKEKKKKKNLGRRKLTWAHHVFLNGKKNLYLSSSKKNRLGAPSGFSAFDIELLFLGEIFKPQN
jgi:hypothetical protein